jgi:hypothetical protein
VGRRLWQVAVPANEWEHVAARVRHFLVRDEDELLGHVLLSVSRHERRWVAANGDAVIVLDGAAVEDEGELEVLLSPRLLQAAASLAGEPSEHVVLELGLDRRTGRVTTTARGSLGSFGVPSGGGDFPDWQELVPRSGRSGASGAMAVLERDNLRRVLLHLLQPPGGVENPRGSVLARVEVADGELSFSVDWHRHGVTRCTLAVATTGAGTATLALCCLGELVESCAAGELRLVLPAGRGGRATLSDGRGVCGSVTARDTLESLRPRTEQVLAAACAVDEVARGDDGDYVLPLGSAPLSARLVPGDPHRLRLFALAAEIDESPALLAELNQLNCSLPFVKFISSSGQVLAAVELDATSAHPDEIASLAGVAVRTAAELGPVLGAVFGGAKEHA